MHIIALIGLVGFILCTIFLLKTGYQLEWLWLSGTVFFLVIFCTCIVIVTVEQRHTRENECKARGDNVLIKSGRSDYICIKKDALG